MQKEERVDDPKNRKEEGSSTIDPKQTKTV
jgi:hypothetical protein